MIPGYTITWSQPMLNWVPLRLNNTDIDLTEAKAVLAKIMAM